MDDMDSVQSVQEGLIDEFVDLWNGILNGQADDI
jgi:hypothetical protein